MLSTVKQVLLIIILSILEHTFEHVTTLLHHHTYFYPS